MSVVISFINQKGGVGKTTTSINLAASLALLEKKILLIDLDPQNNLSTGMGVNRELKESKNIYNLLINKKSADFVVSNTSTKNVDIIPSNQDLAGLESEIINLADKEFLLQRSISNISKNYDYVFIDCPPSLSAITINALVASNSVIIPLQCEFFAMEGMVNILEIIKHIQNSINFNLSLSGVLLTMYDRRNKLSQEVALDVRKNLGNLVYEQVIPRNVKLSEASSYGKPVIFYDSKCSGAISYMMFAKEFLTKKERFL